MKVIQLYIFSSFILICYACHQKESNVIKDHATIPDTSLISSDSKITAMTLKDEGALWILHNYDFSNHAYDNPIYTKRYRTYLREGNDAIMGEEASEKSFDEFVSKWKDIYDIENNQYDRGGFDPPFVKIISCDLKNREQDTMYFAVRVQSIGYNKVQPTEEDVFFEATIKLVPSDPSYAIDEIVYKYDE